MSSKTIFKAVATVTVFSVFTRTLSFIFKIYLSRVLGAEVMGLYQICLSLFFLFSALSASGLPTVLSRKTAEAHALDPNEKGYTLLTAALAIGLTVAVVTAVTLLLLEPFLGKLLSDSRAVPMFVFMLPALVSTCIYSIIRGWFWGTKQFTYFSITETVEEILRILFTLFFVSGIVSGINGAHGIALAFTVSDVTVAIILISMYLAKGGKLKKGKHIMDIAKPALPLTSMRVFGSLVGTALAVLLPARLIDSGLSVSEATASFGRIAGMAGPLLFAPNAIISSLAIVLIPEMSENCVKKNLAALNRHINSGITFSVIVCGLFLSVYFALGKELTAIIFNDVPSGEYLKAASLLLLVMPVNQILTSAMNSIGMEKESFFTFLISAVFMLISIYFLTRFIGVYSVVVANFSMLLTSAGGNMYYLKKRVGLDFGFIKSVLTVALFCLPCALLCRNIYELLEGALGGFALIFALAGSFTLYAVLIAVSGLADIGGFIKTNFLKKRREGSLGKTVAK